MNHIKESLSVLDKKLDELTKNMEKEYPFRRFILKNQERIYTLGRLEISIYKAFKATEVKKVIEKKEIKKQYVKFINNNLKNDQEEIIKKVIEEHESKLKNKPTNDLKIKNEIIQNLENEIIDEYEHIKDYFNIKSDKEAINSYVNYLIKSAELIDLLSRNAFIEVLNNTSGDNYFNKINKVILIKELPY